MKARTMITSAAAAAGAIMLAASPAPAAIIAWWQPVPITATPDGITPAPGIQISNL